MSSSEGTTDTSGQAPLAEGSSNQRPPPPKLDEVQNPTFMDIEISPEDQALGITEYSTPSEIDAAHRKAQGAAAVKQAATGAAGAVGAAVARVATAGVSPQGAEGTNSTGIGRLLEGGQRLQVPAPQVPIQAAPESLTESPESVTRKIKQIIETSDPDLEIATSSPLYFGLPPNREACHGHPERRRRPRTDSRPAKTNSRSRTCLTLRWTRRVNREVTSERNVGRNPSRGS